MPWGRDHIIGCFEPWWKIANRLLRLFAENVEKDRCVGSIFGNKFHILLMYMLYVVYVVLGVCRTLCMLYLMYAVLGVCCTQCMPYSVNAVVVVNSRSSHEETGSDLISLFSAMMGELWKRTRDGEWRWEWYGGHELLWEIRGMTCLIGYRRPHISILKCWMGTRTCHIWDGQLTRTPNSLPLQSLMKISLISFYLSLSHPQLSLAHPQL